MQLYTILSPCKSIPYYPHANLYPIIPMQIYTLLSPWHDNPPFPSAPYIYYWHLLALTNYKDSYKIINFLSYSYKIDNLLSLIFLQV